MNEDHHPVGRPSGERGPLSFVLLDNKRSEVLRQTMARAHFPSIVVWGGRAFRLDDVQSAHPAPAVYVERETFVIGRDT